MSLQEDWPCLCGHLVVEHDFDQVAQKYTACLVKKDVKRDIGEYIKHEVNYVDDCGDFTPISNLEYLEKKHASSIS